MNPETTEEKWIEFDIVAINQLTQDYESTMMNLFECMPDVNWSSRVETFHYLEKDLGLYMDDLKIKTLQTELDYQRDLIESGWEIHDDHAIEVLTGLIEIYKLRYTLRNYLHNILRHQQDGIVKLRNINGEWRMPNKQPLPYDSNITECIKSTNLTKGEYVYGSN